MWAYKVGLKRDWRKLRNGQFHDFSSSPDIIRFTQRKEDEIGWACGTHV